MKKAKETMGGSCYIPSNEQSKRDDGWLMLRSIQMIKAKDKMDGSCRVPSNEQIKRDDGWLTNISHSIHEQS
jgi:hypothetical protein